MLSDGSLHFPALWLLMSVGEQYKRIETVNEAAELLIHHWPLRSGSAYLTALEACLNALQGTSSVHTVQEALIRAADEAFVCYIRVVGGGKRMQAHKTYMSRGPLHSVEAYDPRLPKLDASTSSALIP